MTDLSAAIVGYGLSGAVFHGPLIESTPGMRVATVVTRDPERRAAAAAAHPGATLADSADEVWERAGEHDLVVNATPNDSHVPVATAALDAGLPVVVDKPLAPTAAEARALVEHAESLGLLLTVFHNRRWDSDHLTLSNLRDAGALGDVIRYESRFERWRPQLSPSNPWRETKTAAEGGGVLLDIGSHLVDQALILFGAPTHVYGEVESLRGGADDDAFVALRHGDGAFSHLWASTVAASPGPRLRVLGSRAAYLVEGLDGQEEALRSGRRPGDGEPWGVEPPESWGSLVEGEHSEPVPSLPGAWPEFYAQLVPALREGAPPPVDPRQAITVIEVLDAARASAAAGGPVLFEAAA
jgi:scyllo-inositol 2-dehydrogenase (NADP+)